MLKKSFQMTYSLKYRIAVKAKLKPHMQTVNINLLTKGFEKRTQDLANKLQSYVLSWFLRNKS